MGFEDNNSTNIEIDVRQLIQKKTGINSTQTSSLKLEQQLQLAHFRPLYGTYIYTVYAENADPKHVDREKEGDGLRLVTPIKRFGIFPIYIESIKPVTLANGDIVVELNEDKNLRWSLRKPELFSVSDDNVTEAIRRYDNNSVEGLVFFDDIEALAVTIASLNDRELGKVKTYMDTLAGTANVLKGVNDLTRRMASDIIAQQRKIS